MTERTKRIRWRTGVLPAGVLAVALVGLLGTPASSSRPVDAPVSAEPRVAVAKCLSYPGLVSSKGTGESFTRMDQGDALYSRDLLLAIPGFKVDVEPDSKAVKLTLWGNLPGLSDSPVLESSVVLHDSKAYDLDFTLIRGRVVLTNTKKAGPAKIWLRANAGVHLVLPEPGDSVAMELYGRWPAGVPFSLKPRPGVATVQVWEVHCLKGQIEIKAARIEWQMAAPPGAAYFHGNSIEGPAAGGPEKRAKLPEWADPNTKVLPLAKTIQSVVDAYKEKVKSKDPEEVGAELMVLAEKDEDKERASMTRRLIVYALASQDEVGRVATMLNSSKHDDVRKTAVVALRHWIGGREGRDEKLYATLQDDLGFNKNEASTVMQLLHSPFAPDQAETYETLIAYLKHRRQTVRELAAWHLYRLAPVGRTIAFDAAGSAADLDKASAAWKKEIPSGELPRVPKEETKEKPVEKEKPKVKPVERNKDVEEQSQAARARIVVQVAADATLTFDGLTTAQTGVERHFITPPLPMGKRYYYMVSATWAPSIGLQVVRTRKVYVEGGKTTGLDLLKEDPGQPDKIVNRSAPM